MNYNTTNLMLSLAYQLATLASCQLGGNLFIHQAPVPSGSTKPTVGVLRTYGGPAPDSLSRIPAISLQLTTYAIDPSAGLNFATKFFEALHDPDMFDRPRCLWNLPGKRLSSAGAVENDPDHPTWRINWLTIHQPPGMIGIDEHGRHEIPFNFDVHFSV